MVLQLLEAFGPSVEPGQGGTKCGLKHADWLAPISHQRIRGSSAFIMALENPKEHRNMIEMQAGGGASLKRDTEELLVRPSECAWLEDPTSLSRSFLFEAELRHQRSPLVQCEVY